MKGLKYHLANHFLDDYTPKYFNNKLYPLDIHNYAQGIITFLRFGMGGNARKLALRTVSDMQSEDGYYYYQKHKHLTIKIPYMRWSQAWMYYALSLIVNE